MKKNLLAKNTVASLLAQITTLVCGFILPRFFLQKYGSEVNGLINSIAQFLGVISFLELGVGTVVQSALYKPLVEKNDEQISRVMASANKFFQRLALILLAYVAILTIVYPLLVDQSFDYAFTTVLILAIAISSFAQYYFGTVNSLLLTADQRGYIQFNAQTLTVILNTVICMILIKTGSSVQMVKMASSLIYLIRPVVLRIYINKRYRVNWKILYDKEPIQQKWNGVAQHIAAVVQEGTDTIVLSLLAKLEDVSIYSVYYMVVNGVKTVLWSLTNGIRPVLGELWAKQELENLKGFFGWVEWCIHTGTTFVFACTAGLLVPFIQVYTNGIHDANYTQPVFALLLTLANGMHCLRLPYNIMVLAAGHYKQTQNNYIIAAIMNIVISVATVRLWGLIGVAIGTLLSMAYQTIWLALYNSKNLIYWSMRSVFKQFLADGVAFSAIFFIAQLIPLGDKTYFCWFLQALTVACLAVLIIGIVNCILYKEKLYMLAGKVTEKLLCNIGKKK